MIAKVERHGAPDECTCKLGQDPLAAAEVAPVHPTVGVYQFAVNTFTHHTFNISKRPWCLRYAVRNQPTNGGGFFFGFLMRLYRGSSVDRVIGVWIEAVRIRTTASERCGSAATTRPNPACPLLLDSIAGAALGSYLLQPVRGIIHRCSCVSTRTIYRIEPATSTSLAASPAVI